uniref:BTB domain-containing protein n=2 Tax=Rhodnius prolixus TaxID=13249 RepID=T1I9M9_RHOPR
MAEQFCLRWINHQCTLISVFENLLESETLIDCTLYAEGQILKAHKVVLSACSPYFEKMLCAAEDKSPIIFLKDVKFLELKAMLDYMYKGEVNISQDQLDSFLKTAEALQIKGLTDQRVGGGAPTGGGTVDVDEPPAKKGPGCKTGVSDVAPESPLVGDAPLREDSISPGGTKRRRRVARRPSADETSADNSCDFPPVAVEAQPQPQQTSAPPQATSTPLSADSASFEVKKQEPMEPPTTTQHNMIQPKTEFIEEANEDIEDLTLDDDDDYSEMSKPGTSFSASLQGNTSQQDFTQWQMMDGDRTQTDEVFMAAQEAINNQSNAQG